MTGKKIDRRKKLIQLIHVAKSKLQMSDGDYRALLNGVGGKASSAELTVAGLEQVLRAMKSLGFTVKKLPVTELDRGLASKGCGSWSAGKRRSGR